ncbi:MAG: cytochrome-c peroxidase, partial [Flavobacteriales bacterium]|nr:cytochrome-c peroxidase [Flavobacteriales bacterium]
MKRLICFLLATILLFSCKKEGCIDPIALNYNPDAHINNGSCEYITATPYHIITPYGFPDMIIPENNPMTVEGVSLGEKLFHDKILSGNGMQSCVSCHLQSAAFSDTNQFSEGIDGLFGNRNASTIINAGWNNSNFWDGRVTSLEEQAHDPVVNPIEMNDNWPNVENKLNANSEYVQLFKQAFNIDYIDSNHVVMAIAQ